MATFSATAGTAKVTAQIDDFSNEIAAGIAALEGDPTLNNKIVAAGLSAVADMVNDRDVFMAFAAGTHAQSSGQPAKALGTGTSTTSSDPLKDAWHTIMTHTGYSDGQKNAALRVFADPSDPKRIKVENDGTPAEIKGQNASITSLTTERDTAIRERDTAQRELAAEKAKSAPTGTVKKADLKSEMEDLKKVIATFDGSKPKLVTVKRSTAEAIVAKAKALLAKIG